MTIKFVESFHPGLRRQADAKGTLQATGVPGHILEIIKSAVAEERKRRLDAGARSAHYSKSDWVYEAVLAKIAADDVKRERRLDTETLLQILEEKKGEQP